jgi:hypothetical protein
MQRVDDKNSDLRNGMTREEALEAAKTLIPHRGVEIFAEEIEWEGKTVYEIGFYTLDLREWDGSPAKIIWQVGESWEDAISGGSAKRIAATAKFGRLAQLARAPA